MMGLALGVDYALLMVSRFREELAAGAPPAEAAALTRHTAGRTTAFAGSTLFLAMAVTLLVMPGSLFLSLAGTAIVVTASASPSPAWWRRRCSGARPPRQPLAPRRRGGGKRLMGAVGAALARPRLAAG